MHDETTGEVSPAPNDVESPDAPSWQRWGIPLLSLVAVAAALVALWAANQAQRSREEIQLIELGPEVDESGFEGFVVPQGRLRASFLGLFEPDQVAHDVRMVLEE